MLAQDTTPTPSRYTKTIHLFIRFHQDYNTKMRLEKKIHMNNSQKCEMKVRNTQQSEAPN